MRHFPFLFSSYATISSPVAFHGRICHAFQCVLIFCCVYCCCCVVGFIRVWCALISRNVYDVQQGQRTDAWMIKIEIKLKGSRGTSMLLKTFYLNLGGRWLGPINHNPIIFTSSGLLERYTQSPNVLSIWVDSHLFWFCNLIKSLLHLFYIATLESILVSFDEKQTKRLQNLNSTARTIFITTKYNLKFEYEFQWV